MKRCTTLLLLALAVLTGCQDRDLPTGVAPPPAPNFLLVPSTVWFTQVGAGYEHSCALRSDGAVECWGNNGSGQAPAKRSAAKSVFTEVAVGGGHTCALRSDGVVECWGVNEREQAPPSRSAAAGSTFTQVSAGLEHTCALRSDGVVECWGYDYSGQAPAIRPAAVGMTFTQVGAGLEHTCALRSDGAVECWGSNSELQAPTSRSGAGTFTQVSGGAGHTCALRSGGDVECWGSNGNNQAPASRSATPGTTFTQVSAGVSHTCGLRSDGAAECWGYNGFRQAPAERYAFAYAVGDTSTFTQLDAGMLHTCGVSAEGVVQCWGLDNAGQAPPIKLATQTTTILPTATFTATPAAVIVGQSFALALSSAQVPGWSGPVTFAYAFDCGDGGGYRDFGPSHTASCPTSAAGTRTVKGTVRDEHGDQAEYTAVVQVTTIALSVGANGTINRRTGAATISGTASCPAARSLTLTVSLEQTQTRGRTPTTVSGSGSIGMVCSGAGPTAWAVSVTPAAGRFAAGAARATASATGARPASQTVQLN